MTSLALRNAVADLDIAPITVTSSDFSRHYDLSSIVYLSPDSPHVMSEYKCVIFHIPLHYLTSSLYPYLTSSLPLISPPPSPLSHLLPLPLSHLLTSTYLTSFLSIISPPPSTLISPPHFHLSHLLPLHYLTTSLYPYLLLLIPPTFSPLILLPPPPSPLRLP